MSDAEESLLNTEGGQRQPTLCGRICDCIVSLIKFGGLRCGIFLSFRFCMPCIPIIVAHLFTIYLTY